MDIYKNNEIYQENENTAIDKAISLVDNKKHINDVQIPLNLMFKRLRSDRQEQRTHSNQDSQSNENILKKDKLYKYNYTQTNSTTFNNTTVCSSTEFRRTGIKNINNLFPSVKSYNEETNNNNKSSFKKEDNTNIKTSHKNRPKSKSHKMNSSINV